MSIINYQFKKILNIIMDESYKKILLEKHPYMSYIVYGGNDYVGIIQNVDDSMTTIYDIGSLKTDEQKLAFLQLSEVWWWESNRLVPINVFLKKEWEVFRFTLKILNSKEVEIKVGPYVSLKEIALRKSKRRSITLIRKMP